MTLSLLPGEVGGGRRGARGERAQEAGQGPTGAEAEERTHTHTRTHAPTHTPDHHLTVNNHHPTITDRKTKTRSP